MTSAHPPDDIRIYYKECRSLNKAGYDITLLVNRKISKNFKDIRVKKVFSADNRLLRIMLSPLFFFIAGLREKASLYHLHDPELLITGILLKLSGKKVLYDAHEDTSRQILSKYYLNTILRHLFSRVIRLIENFAALFMDGVITTSESIKNGFPFSSHPKITLVRNYPDIEEFSINSERNNNHGVCYVGAMSLSRGLMVILESLRYHSATIELAGHFYPASLENTVYKEGNRSRIVYHGVVGRESIKKIYTRCSVGLVVFQPNQHHHVILPIKLFEYMAAGLPVIASDFPLWKEIVENNECGICIDPTDSALLGATIKKLLTNEELRKKMGENGRKAVREKYNWISEEKNLVDLYNKIIS
jgi:glycosyltransferase involved in cell wall biosynthesis